MNCERGALKSQPGSTRAVPACSLVWGWYTPAPGPHLALFQGTVRPSPVGASRRRRAARCSCGYLHAVARLSSAGDSHFQSCVPSRAAAILRLALRCWGSRANRPHSSTPLLAAPLVCVHRSRLCGFNRQGGPFRFRLRVYCELIALSLRFSVAAVLALQLRLAVRFRP